MSEKTIEQVLNEHTNAWMEIPGVEGTAIGASQGKPCIMILCSRNPEEISNRIPSIIEGHLVIFQNTGQFRAL